VYHAYYYSLTRGLTFVSFHIWNMYYFIDSFCDDEFGTTYGPVEGTAKDHFWGARSHLAGTDVE
jgi:hypothetical protein